MFRNMAGGNGNAQDYWKQSSLTYKFFLITSSLILVISLIFSGLITVFIDVPVLTIWSFQIWRLVFSMFGQMPNIMALLSLLFSFMWINQHLKDNEHSTVYKLIEVFVINFQIHIVFNLISLVFTLIFETSDSLIFLGYGWFPIIIVYQFRMSVIDPETSRNFCCLPFMIKNKYYPWVLLALLGLLSTQFVCFIACGMVGYYQEVVKKDMIIKLPYSLYQKLEKCLPNTIKQRPDFISITRVEAELKKKCSKCSRQQAQEDNNNNNNYFQNERQRGQEVQAPASVIPSSFFSAGAEIGGAKNSNFKNHWANKGNSGQAQMKDENNNQKRQGADYQQHYQNLQGDSYAGFGESGSQDKRLLKEQQKNKLKNKENTESDLI